MKDEVMKYVKVIAGSFLFSLGIYLFITPSALNSGGVVGVAQILNLVLRPLNPNPENLDLTGFMNLLLNVPLYILALRSISKSFCIRTLISILIQMVTLSLLPPIHEAVMPDMLSMAYRVRFMYIRDSWSATFSAASERFSICRAR